MMIITTSTMQTVRPPHCASVARRLFSTGIGGSSAGGAPAASLATHFAHLKNDLRARDLPSYHSLAHAPAASRPGVLAVRAFNVEIAAVRDAVRDAAHGRMRIQWWRDTVDAAFAGRPPAAPIAQAVAAVARKYRLDRALVDKYLDARAMDFVEPSPLASLAGVEDYAELTQSAVLHLCLQCAGVSDAPTRLVASHVGKAIGLSLLLRSVPFMAAQGKVVLPLELLGKYKVNRKSLLAGQASAGATDATYELACIGKNHMDQARALTDTVDAAHRVHFLPLLAAEDFFTVLERERFDPFAPALAQPFSSLSLQLRMLKHRVLRTF